MAALVKLSDLVAGYEANDPQTGSQLFQADYAELSPIAQDLRRHMIDAVHGSSSKAIVSPLDAKKLLADGHLFTLARKWVCYALDGDRKRILVPGRDQSRHWARCVSRKVPAPERLTKDAHVPDGGGYLVVYGGGPKILSVHDAHGGGVANDLVTLQKAAPIIDVLFWHLESDQAPALYSLAVGQGDRNNEAVLFPDPTSLQKARGE